MIHSNILNYWQLLNDNTQVTNKTIYSDELDKPKEDKNKPEEELKKVDEIEDAFLDNITNYVLHTNNDNPSQDTVTTFLNKIIPNTKTLFSIVKKYISGRLSIEAVVGYLEPFLIYTNDLTFKQYEEIIKFLDREISNYNINYLERDKAFKFFFSRIGSLSQAASIETLLGVLNTNNQIKSDIIKKYDMEQTMKLKTNSEALTDIVKLDFGTTYLNAVSLENLNLMFPENISTIIEKNKELLEQNINNFESTNKNKCLTYVISKQYTREAELVADNGKTIYFDKKFDNTNYQLFEDKNGIMNKDIERAQNILSAEEYNDYLIDILQKKYKYDEKEASYMVETLTNKLKRVMDGNIAILFEDDEYKYYKRINNIWQLDETIDSELIANSGDILCNVQSNCIDVQLSHNESKCEPIELNKKEIAQRALNEVIVEFDKKYEESKEKMEIILNKKYNYAYEIIDKLKKIKKNRLYKYNNEQYKFGLKVEGNNSSRDDSREQNDIELLVSPYKNGLDLILGQSDFVKKQNDIILFAQRFTRVPDNKSSENVNWRYCIQTGTKLLPLFLYELATCFVETPDKYIAKMNELIRKHGKLSDDGNECVMDYCGYVLTKINFSEDEGFDESGRIKSTRGVIEEDVGSGIVSKLSVSLTQSTQNKKENYGSNPTMTMITNIMHTLSENMSISLDNSQKEFMIKLVTDTLVKVMISEEKYNTNIETAAKKGKKLPPYKEMYNEIVLYLTFGSFLIGLQTSTPSIRTKKTYPGCVRSFQGYPFDGEGDVSSLNYLSCVIYKSKSRVEPWNVLMGKRHTDSTISTNIKKYIDAYYLSNESVKRKFVEKTEFLLSNKENEFTIPSEHSINKWTEFLPPLVSININKSRLLNVTEEFKSKFLRELKDGSIHQIDSLLTIESRIIFFSLAIQECVQDIINKKDLLLKNSQREPFIENSCCNEKNANSNTETPIGYFNKENGEISKYNEYVKDLSNIINDVINITRAPYLFSRENTKLIYPSIGNEFNEEVIYEAFIKFCKFHATNAPLSGELTAICNNKPAYLDSKISIYNKIKKLKEDGRNYDNDSMLRLLQIVGAQNIIHISRNTVKPTPIQKIQSILEDIKKDVDEKVVSLKLITHMEDVLDTYDVAVKEDTDEMRNLKDYLETKNTEMKEIIQEFINSSSGITINKKKKTNSIINQIMSWSKLVSTRKSNKKGKFLQESEKGGDDGEKGDKGDKTYKDIKTDSRIQNKIADDNTYNSINFIKSYLQNIIKIFPTIILNKVKNSSDDVKISGSSKLAIGEVFKIQNIIGSYYQGLRKFYDDVKLRNVLVIIQKRCSNLLTLATHTPYFTEINYKNEIEYSIFDKPTCELLFEHYFLLTLLEYTKLAKDVKILTMSFPDKDSRYNKNDDIELMSVDYLDDNNEHYEPDISLYQQGDIKDVRNSTASLFDVYLNIINDHKNLASLSYETIMDFVFKEREKEKNKITDVLKSMSDEERGVNNILKINKLGMWGKGLEKGLTVYTKDRTDEERDLLEKNAVDERRMIRKGIDIDDFDEELEAVREEAEEFDLRNLNEEWEAGGDYGGAGAEEEDYGMYD